MPLNIDFLQILLHMLNFVILAGGLFILLYKPVNQFLEQRKNYFADLEKRNKESLEENKKIQMEYEKKIQEADAEIAERKKIAEKEWAETSARYIEEAKVKAAAIILAAEKEAEERKDHILESAQTEIGELVLEAAQKLLSDTVTAQRDSIMTQVLNLSIDYDLLADKVAERIAGSIPDKGDTSDKGQKVYGIRGIAEYIGCSPAKAQNMKNAGILPFYEVGRRVFFYTSEVDKALKKEDR